jgi:hypothetical protein
VKVFSKNARVSDQSSDDKVNAPMPVPIKAFQDILSWPGCFIKDIQMIGDHDGTQNGLLYTGYLTWLPVKPHLIAAYDPHGGKKFHQGVF